MTETGMNNFIEPAPMRTSAEYIALRDDLFARMQGKPVRVFVARDIATELDQSPWHDALWKQYQRRAKLKGTNSLVWNIILDRFYRAILTTLEIDFVFFANGFSLSNDADATAFKLAYGSYWEEWPD